MITDAKNMYTNIIRPEESVYKEMGVRESIKKD